MKIKTTFTAIMLFFLTIGFSGKYLITSHLENIGVYFEGEGIGVVESENGYLLAATLWDEEKFSGKGFGGNDGILMEFDDELIPLREKIFGGSSRDIFYDIIRTEDGGYIITGETESKDAAEPKPVGDSDIWVIRLDSTLNILWNRLYGKASRDTGLKVCSVEDGFIVLGWTRSDVYGGREFDAVVLKLDEDGNELFYRQYGGSGEDVPEYLIEVDDGYLIFANSESEDHDLRELRRSKKRHFWIYKIDKSNGEIIQNKRYVYSDIEEMNSVCQVEDGFIVTGFFSDQKRIDLDVWIAKMGYDFRIQWEEIFRGEDTEYPCNVVYSRQDDRVVLTVMSESKQTEDFPTNLGYLDVWVFSFDQNDGQILSREYISGNDYDQVISTDALSNGKVFVSGFTTSTDGQLNSQDREFRVFVTKLGY